MVGALQCCIFFRYEHGGLCRHFDYTVTDFLGAMNVI